MLTIFASPKRFTGQFDLIQRNAITSWTCIEPRCEVLVFGDDDGTAEACADLGVRHVPGVATSDLGTPLVSDMFQRAEALATGDVLCFVNADIVAGDDSAAAADIVAERQNHFLSVARRWDLDVTQPLEAERTAVASLQARARRTGHRASEIAIDWFVFSRGLFSDLPDFAVGRSGYDNWLIWKAVTSGAAVVDASAFVTLVHQNHDYSHAGGTLAVWEGPEARRAHDLIGDWRRYFSISHAPLMMTADGDIVRSRGWRYRLARPRRIASHLLRFTRPLRRRLAGIGRSEQKR